MLKYRLCICFLIFLLSGKDKEILKFSQSFIDGYCFHPEGRFSREYHPYLLKKTKESLASLERYLQKRDFNLAERVLIMGYEQNAVPSYFNCLSRKQIEDEAVTKTESGWEFAPGNVFGFLTGYLFKDAAFAQQDLVEHVAKDSVEIFNEGTEILQKHAFGKWYETILGYQASIQKWIENSDYKKIFNGLINFWKSIYEAESSNVQGNRFATQDILFSFYYVKHLMSSVIPIKKLFVGPDISYPIEVTRRQSIEVTRNAQAFVSRFVNLLKPVNNQKTVYVFWSFVDGVGKSTLLGNICNWLVHKDDYAKYSHVSNASSQRATLYEVNDEVVIADLPAQISHYSAKPDGHVYIDLGFSTELLREDVAELKEYVITHFQEIVSDYEDRMDKVAGDSSVTVPEDAVIKNIKMLEVRSAWRPFAYKDHHYVVNVYDPRQIRIMTSFENVHSQGLKIKEPELMIFDKGLSIPMSYDFFMKDLADQLEKVGVQQVVFVDFLSMYPRTCRETIRINYLLQQLKAFYKDEYVIEKSAYRSFAHYHELYPLFFDYKDDFERSLFLETLLRWVIHDTIVQASIEDLSALSTQAVHERLNKKIKDLYVSHKDDVDEILCEVRKRLEQEEPTIKHYQLSQFYEAVTHFSVDRFAQLSEMVRSLVVQFHTDDAVRELWTELGEEIKEFSDDGRFVVLENDIKLEVVRPLRGYDVDRSLVESLANEARRSWYSHLIGLIVPELNESFKVAFLVKKFAGEWLILRYRHPEIIEEPPALLEEVRQFGMSGKQAYDVSYARSWVTQLKRTTYHHLYKDEAQKLFVPISDLVEYLDLNKLWTLWTLESRDMLLPKPATISYEATRWVIHALVTLHMNLKSPEDDMMIRYGNQQDFVSGLRLFENLMFPKYMNLTTKGELFPDYWLIEPLVGEFKKDT